MSAIAVETDRAERPEAANPVRFSRGRTITARTLGEAWLDVAGLILTEGAPGSFDGLPLLEVELVTLDIAEPDPDDALIARHASADWLAWMRANFTDHSRVAELGGARSYASRLFDYAGSGRDQLAWVVDRLTRDPAASDTTITTFEPLTDTTYTPCVSLLDFWLRSGRLELVVYAHSIDFGKKGFGNLVQLAELQRHVAARLGASAGRLTLIVKSATIYDADTALMRQTLDAARSGAF
ncbi:MAG: thymidylate synthase [Roseiarcus sp.]